MSDPSGTLAFKVRHIFAPTLALSILLASVYSLLNWLLVAGNGLVPLDENVARFWLPSAVSWVLVIVLIQPRLRLMKDDAQDNLPVFYHFAAVAVVALPTIIAQGYVAAASGGITYLKELNEIGSGAATKHYVVDSLCFKRSEAVVHPVVRLTGKNKQTIEFSVYALMPACRQSDLGSGSHLVWIGQKFQESHRSSLSTSERETKLVEFVRRSAAQFRQRDEKSIRYFTRLGHNSDRKDFEQALQHAGIGIESSSIVLIPHTEAYEQRTGNSLPWAFASFGIATVAWLIAVLLRPLDSKRLKRWRRGGKRRKEDTSPLLAVLIPSRESYGLPLLLDINILVFVAMVMAGLGFVSFERDDLLRWGANYRPALHDFGLLRLISSQFVHGGVMHLANNLYGLLMAGMFLVPVTGNAGLIACYLIAGLGGSVASAFMKAATVSVGASGAIFGLFGILLALLTLRDVRVAPLRQFILINVVVFVGLNLLIGAFSSGIDNAAHVGGLAVGAALGVGIFVSERFKQGRQAT